MINVISVLFLKVPLSSRTIHTTTLIFIFDFIFIFRRFVTCCYKSTYKNKGRVDVRISIVDVIIRRANVRISIADVRIG